jgi:hypothetical protein
VGELSSEICQANYRLLATIYGFVIQNLTQHVQWTH